MTLPPPQFYTGKLGPSAIYRVTLKGSSRAGFVKPASVVCPKLYVAQSARGQVLHSSNRCQR